MSNTIELKIKVGDDGTLSIVTKEAGKAAAAINKVSSATDKTTKSRDKFNKTEKGVGQLTSNSTKAFSKQAQSLGSGLVPAYAALAANIFAVSMAFNALKKAAATEQLAKGLEYVGNAAGKNLSKVAQSLREITGLAISTREAMESVAIGVSAGFSTSQMENLTKVAKGASLALGRDMGDAMSRLTKGAAKLEPEVLDELGIMVRLDTVSRAYATTVGKTATELTQFEKRMAFTNAIIDQGTKKFGAIAKAIDPNPFDRLSASFEDLTKSFLNLLNKGIIPIINIIGTNQGSLIGIMSLFGTTITKQMVPGMYRAAEAAAIATEEQAKFAESQIIMAASSDTLSASSRAAAKAVLEGGDVQKGITKVMTNQQKSLKINTAWLKTYRNQALEAGGADEALSAKIKKKVKDLKASRNALKETTMAMRARATVEAKNLEAEALSSASSLQVVSAYKQLKNSIIKYIVIGKAANLNLSSTAKAANIATTSLRITAATIKTVGSAFLSFLPYLGLIITGFSLLYEGYKKLTKKTGVAKALDDAKKSYEGLIDAGMQLETVMQSQISADDKRLAQMRVEIGTLDSLEKAILAVIAARAKESSKSIGTNSSKIDEERAIIDTNIKSTAYSSNKKLLGLKDNILNADTLLKAFQKDSLKLSHTLSIIDPSGYEQVVVALNQLNRLTIENANTSFRARMISKDTASSLINDFTREAKIAGTMTDRTGKQLSALLASVNKYTTTADFLKKFRTIKTEGAAAINSVDTLGQVLSKVNKEVTSLGVKARGPFDALISSIKVVGNSLKTALYDPATTAKFVSDFKTIDSSLYNLITSFSTLSGEASDIDTLSSGVENLIKTLDKANKEVVNSKVELGTLKNIVVSLKKASLLDPKKVVDYYNAQKNVSEKAISILESEKTLNSILVKKLDIDKQSELLSAKPEQRAKIIQKYNIMALNANKALLETDQKIEAEKLKILSTAQVKAKTLVATLDLEKTQLDLNTKLTAETTKQVSLQEKQAKLAFDKMKAEAGVGSREGSSAIVDLAMYTKINSAKQAAAEAEYQLKVKQVTLEYQLLHAKNAERIADSKAWNTKNKGKIASGKLQAIDVTPYENIKTLYEEINKIQLKNLSTEHAINIEQNDVKGLALQKALQDEILQKTQSILTSKKSLLNSDQSLAKAKLQYNNMITTSDSTLSAQQELDLFNQQKDARLAVLIQEKTVKEQIIAAEYALIRAQAEQTIANAKVKKADIVAKGTPDAVDQGALDTQNNIIEATNRRLEIQGTLNELQLSQLDTALELQKVQNDTSGLEKQSKVLSETFSFIDEALSNIGDDSGFGAIVSSAFKAFKTTEKAAKRHSKILTKLDTAYQEQNKAKHSGNAKDIEAANKEVLVSEKAKNKSQLSMASETMGGIGDIMSALSSTMDTESRSQFEIAKALNIGAAVMNTAQAITAALAIGPPQGYVMAALSAAMGAAQIAAIASTKFGGAASAPSVSAVATGSFGGGTEGPSNTVGIKIGDNLKYAGGYSSDEAMQGLAEAATSASLAMGDLTEGFDRLGKAFEEGSGEALAARAYGLANKTVAPDTITDMDKYWETFLRRSHLALDTVKTDQLTARAYTMAQSDVFFDKYLQEGLGKLTRDLISPLQQAVAALGTSTQGPAAPVSWKVFNSSWSQEDMAAALQANANEAADNFAKTVAGLEEVAKPGERAATALMRLQKSLYSFNKTAELANLTLLEGLSGANIASKIADIVGDADELDSAMNTYFETVFSSTEQAIRKAATAEDRVSAVFDKLILDTQSSEVRALNIDTSFISNIPKTTEELQNLVNILVEGINSADSQGIQDYYASVFGSIMSNIEDFSTVFERAADVASDKFDLDVRYLELTGHETEALTKQRNKELESLDPTLWALQRQVWALEDVKDAENSLTEARINAAKTIDDLINQLMGGSSAPVQSMEFFDNQYSGLLNSAISAQGTADFDEAISELTGAIPNILKFTSAYGGDYNTAFTGIVKDLKWLRPEGYDTYPMYASGGYHSGGLRVVGEDGPELELTGSSHIYSNSDSSGLIYDSMLAALENSQYKGTSAEYSTIEPNFNIIVQVGDQEIKDKHVSWHRTDNDTREAVRRDLRS